MAKTFNLNSQILVKFQTIADLILENNQITVLGHINPDGDCIGAQQGLFYSLKKTFPKKIILAPFAKTISYQFLLPDNYQNQIDLSNITNSLFLLVDLANKTRLPAPFVLIKNKVVRIDHHPLVEKNFGNLLWIEPDMTSACEMVYIFLKTMSYHLDHQVARALLTGIITDTGNFTYGNVTPQTLMIVSDLVKLGVNLNELHQHLNLETFYDWKIKSLLMKDFQRQDKVIYFIFKPEQTCHFPWLKTNKEVKKFINIFAHLKGIQAWCLIVQINIEAEISCSIRSKNKVIDELATQYGGGGHPLASGIVFPNWQIVNSFLKDFVFLINN